MITTKKIYTCLALLFCAPTALFGADNSQNNTGLITVKIKEVNETTYEIGGLKLNDKISTLKQKISEGRDKKIKEMEADKDMENKIKKMREQMKKETANGKSVWKLPAEKQRIIFGGRQLEDKEILGDCNIKDGSILHLLIRKYPKPSNNNQNLPRINFIGNGQAQQDTNNNLDLVTSLIKNPKSLMIIVPTLLLLSYLVVRLATKKKAPKHYESTKNYNQALGPIHTSPTRRYTNRR